MQECPTSISNSTTSHSVGVLIEDGKTVSIDETEQADVTMFAEVWLKNIRVQQRVGETI
jgi:hypothetical protein